MNTKTKLKKKCKSQEVGEKEIHISRRDTILTGTINRIFGDRFLFF